MPTSPAARPAHRPLQPQLARELSSEHFMQAVSTRPLRSSPSRTLGRPPTPPTESPARDGRKMRLIGRHLSDSTALLSPSSANGTSPISTRRLGLSSGGAGQAPTGSVGVLALRGEGSRIAVFAAARGASWQDVEGLLVWAEPENPSSTGAGVELRRSDGCVIVFPARAWAAGAATSLCVAQGAQAGAIAVVLIAKDDARHTLSADLAASNFPVVSVRAEDGPAIHRAMGNQARLLFPLHAMPPPEPHRLSLTNLLDEAGPAAASDAAMVPLRRALRDAEDSMAVAVAESARRAEAAEARALFLEGMVKDLSSGVEEGLRRALAEEKHRVSELEEQLHVPEVQILLASLRPTSKSAGKAGPSRSLRAGATRLASTRDMASLPTPARPTLFEAFDAGPAGGGVMSVGKASELLGKTKPGEIAAAAAMLEGKAAEDIGSEDAEVLRLKKHLRVKEGNKFFNKWYNLLQWRTLSKVVRENVIPLPQIVSNKTGFAASSQPPLPEPPLKTRSVPASGRPTSAGEHVQMATHSNGHHTSAADGRMTGAAGDSLTGAVARSFVIEVQSLEKEVRPSNFGAFE